MEILFISHKYPPTIGGMEKQCFELIAHASKKNHVHQLVHNIKKESKLIFFLKIRQRVKNILQKHPGIEVIHLNDGLMGLFLLWLKKYTNIPVVITFHGLDLVFPNKFYQRFIAKKYIRYDAAICVSQATAEECIKRNFKSQNVFVVPNGVDHDIASFESNLDQFYADFYKEHNIDLKHKKVIAMLGRPVQRKGFSWFVNEVVQELADDVQVVMVGPLKDKKPFWKKILPQKIVAQIELAQGGRSDENNLKQALQNSLIKNKVIQTGKLPYHQVMEILTLAKLFVMPNIKKEGDAEGFGLVALEASLRKTVVLASELEGITEAIQDNKNGYLLPSANKSVWIKKIETLLDDVNQLEESGIAFQQFTLANYSWEKMANGYVGVFEKVINRNNKGLLKNEKV